MRRKLARHRRGRKRKNSGNKKITAFLLIILLISAFFLLKGNGIEREFHLPGVPDYFSSLLKFLGENNAADSNDGGGKEARESNQSEAKQGIQGGETNSSPDALGEVSRSNYEYRTADSEEGTRASAEESLLMGLIAHAVAGAGGGRNNSTEDFAEKVVVSGATDANDLPQVISSPTDQNAVKKEITADQAIDSNIEGAVFIYHTHSTESFEPYSDGNYHITGDAGTVRNVGDALATGLTAKGITVYHDKTLHDNPSYTGSYGRSLNTAKNYLSQYNDIKVMIDLHRDATSAGGKKYPTVDVNGVKATAFNIVVGRENSNYTQLMSFANLILKKAEELYPGLAGRIIEREYKFNEYLCDYYLLLEVGNNGNTIGEAEKTGTLLADVIEAAMREI